MNNYTFKHISLFLFSHASVSGCCSQADDSLTDNYLSETIDWM